MGLVAESWNGQAAKDAAMFEAGEEMACGKPSCDSVHINEVRGRGFPCLLMILWLHDDVSRSVCPMPIGDFYALAAAFSWSISVVLMRVSGFQIPPLPLTFFKNCVALVGFAVVLLWQGESWWQEISGGACLRLIASGVLGISLADTMIAAALNRLGASLHALADCAYSPAIACVGFLMFGEVLGPWELVGGALVVSGVFVGAVMTPEVKKPRDLWVGFVLAASAHIIMAIGILMIRDVYRETSIVWVSAVRFLVASVVMLLWARVKFPKVWRKMILVGFQRRDTWKTMIPMAVFGPFLATLSWVAGFKYLEAGRAAIFNQMSTVFIIGLACLFLKERMTVRKWIGTALAVAGSVLVALS